MKLVTYDRGDGVGRPGALLGDGERILDLAAATDGAIASIQGLIEGGDAALERARQAEACPGGRGRRPILRQRLVVDSSPIRR